MQAAVYHTFGGPIRVQEVPIPACPPDGVVLQVKAVGVCRSDWHGWKGHDGDIIHHGLPFVPGHEVSGIVVQTRVTKFRVGDRIAAPFILSCGHCEYCATDQSTVCRDQKQPGFTQYGGMAEYLALPRAERNLCLIPDAVSFPQAAALGCRFTTAFRAVVQQGRLQAASADAVAVFGCGGLGLSCIMLAKAQKCKTIFAVDVSPDALVKALELGATHAIHSLNLSASSIRDQIRRVTQTDGAHLTVEASGFAQACECAIECTRPGGRMVQVGLVKEPIAASMDIIAAREIHVVGSHGFAATDLPDLLQMVAMGQLDPSVLIEREVTLQEGAQAIEDMDHGSPLGITMVTKFPSRRLPSTGTSKL